MVDAIVCQDWFIKIAIPARTGHVWTSKISFVKGLSPSANTSIDKINPSVRVPDTAAALKEITFSISIDHCEPNKYA